jgi:hypothetical protein
VAKAGSAFWRFSYLTKQTRISDYGSGLSVGDEAPEQ